MCELTILMPCLNEAETLEICINKAKSFIEKHKIDAEVLISDNGSTDGSQEIATRCGARVVHAKERGYGAALINGCNEAYGKYVIMGDADDSYDFENLMPFVDKLREGYELVMGNRFKGGIEPGAMPPLHKYIGNPVLSFIGRLFFKSRIGDFHCGLRGYNREKILKLNLKTTGMEYASEMVVMSELAGLKICEVPTTLKKDGRTRPPHLRSFRDGWRHLKFLFIYSPNWLFLYPGIIMLAVAGVMAAILSVGQVMIGSVIFSIHSLLYCCTFAIVGFNIIVMFLQAKLYVYNTSSLLRKETYNWNEKINEDLFIFGGIITTIIGLALLIISLILWSKSDFHGMVPETLMRFVIPSSSFIIIGCQSIFAGFLMGTLKNRS